jgi:hypothetical protein
LPFTSISVIIPYPQNMLFLEEPKMKRRKKKSLIRGWRNKLVFLLVVYFAGFATAIYCLAPVPSRTGERGFADSVLKSDKFAVAFNEGLHKLIDFGKSAALYTADLIKEGYHQANAQADG